MLGLFKWLLHGKQQAAAAATGSTGAACTTQQGTRLSIPFLATEPYAAPAWANGLKLVPKARVGLGMLPTPIHRWHLPGLPDGVEVFIKRDDLSGMQMSGNKVRKLEFLMAEALAGGHDCVITIGGIQSNHARATAVAAKYLGLGCHLILRTTRQAVDSDPGLTGNLLVDRMVGAVIHQVTKEEYGRLGGAELCRRLEAQLRAQGLNPYVIPVGGSNGLGCWGYLQAVEEMRVQLGQQQQLQGITDVAMACGSGGTTAGLALGCHLSGLGARVHAYGVCDTPDYFYDFIDGLLADLGEPADVISHAASDVIGSSSDAIWSSSDVIGSSSPGGMAAAGSRGLLRAVQARGAGYAISQADELATVMEISRATGVILDPVYSGKAVHYMLSEMRAHPEEWRGRRVLFVHTGGLLGMYDKEDQLMALVQAQPAAAAAAAAAAVPPGAQPAAAAEATSATSAGAAGGDGAAISPGVHRMRVDSQGM